MAQVSVVVPIYGVEKYIERCARSLFEQTLDDMEYVFVDDCTKDNSMTVLERVIEDYPQRKNQIKILHHEENKGLSFARETGVKEATGEYIAHCDSDDWVEKTMYEEMYDEAIEKGFDFLRCNYRITDGERVYGEGHIREDEDLSDKTKLIGWVVSDQGWNSIWCTLTARSLYMENNISFTREPMLEDMVVVLQLTTYAKKIGVINKRLYNYFFNPLSISKTKNPQSIKKRCDSANTNIKWILSYIESYYDEQKIKKEIIALKTVPRRDLIVVLNDKKNYQYWLRYFPEIGVKPVFNRLLNIKLRVQYLLAWLRLYPLFYKLYKGIKS